MAELFDITFIVKYIERNRFCKRVTHETSFKLKLKSQIWGRGVFFEKSQKNIENLTCRRVITFCVQKIRHYQLCSGASHNPLYSLKQEA